MSAKKLIEINNEKRKLLTKENEQYYSDLLVYIRLQLMLSEQKSEEILMELLDHLLEGQEEGKTAEQIFGHNPKEYADEIILQLPKEEKRKVVPFIFHLILHLSALFLLVRGGILLTLGQFVEIKTEVYPINAFILFSLILCIVAFGVWYIFKLIKDSLFTEKRNDRKNMVKAGIFGALGMIAILTLVNFTPNIGPSYQFPWHISILIGVIMYGISKWIKVKTV